MGLFTSLWNLIDGTVYLIGWVTAFLVLCSIVAAIIAWFLGILRPLYRLGLGLSRKRITIIANSEDSESLTNLIRNSKIFSDSRIRRICSREDAEDIRISDVVLYKYSGSPFTLREVLEKKDPNASIVVYAKPMEIKDPADWLLMDEFRNVSVCNLKGRLLNDLLTLMMTTKL
ncbi:hypothetical protein KC926_01105 [Candidatus Kaiserbacteria bacterium]|nr:hypothetical protein [Candidatus Kaiserbacteria bacterium]